MNNYSKYLQVINLNENILKKKHLEKDKIHHSCRSCFVFFKPLTRADKLCLGLSSVNPINDLCKKCIKNKKVIKKIPTVNKKKIFVKKKVRELNKCSICLDTIKKKTKWDKLARGKSTIDKFPKNISMICGHVFHSKCILEWLKENDTCPNCRNII